MPSLDLPTSSPSCQQAGRLLSEVIYLFLAAFLQMMDEVTYELHPCGAPLLMVPRDEDPQIEMQIEHQGKGEEGWLVGFEQTLRAGTWKGRSELQYVQRVLDNGERIFCGKRVLGLTVICLVWSSH